MNNNQGNNRESGIVILALFALIIIGLAIAALVFVIKKQQGTDGKTEINIQSTINL